MRLTLLTSVIIICDKFAPNAKPYTDGIGLVLAIMLFAAFLDVKDAFFKSN